MAVATSIDGTPTNGKNPWIDSLVWGGAWRSAGTSKVTITYSFKDGIDPSSGNTTVGKSWKASEKSAMRTAMKMWEAVAKIDFVEKSPGTSGTDMWLWLFDEDALGTSAAVAEVPDPDEDVFEPLYLMMNTDDRSWKTQGSLKAGGWSMATMVHELGHALGLAHPHDGGVRPNGNLFPGVTSDTGDYGDFNLNQGIYTVMSYNDGWAGKYPNHADRTFGNPTTPMALDIAAIQAIYGANTDYRRGDDTYLLPGGNLSGTGWKSIWDTGGTDAISAGTTTRSVTINLNPATGAGAGGGGYVSYVTGVVGGFTIAKGVVIEKALGGRASDTIIGNNSTNALAGSGGNDKISARGGNDRLYGGAGNDVLNGGSGIDTVYYSSISTPVDASLTRKSLKKHGVLGVDTYTSIENLIGGSGNDRLEGDVRANFLDGRLGADRLVGSLGDDRYVFDNRGDWATEKSGQGTDSVSSSVSVTSNFADKGSLAYIGASIEVIKLTGTASSMVVANNLSNTVTGNSGNNKLSGKDGSDTINGASGNDRIDGGSGADRLTGGAGLDSFVFSSQLGADDVITQFTAADDSIVLDRRVFVALQQPGNLQSANFVSGPTALDTDDHVLFDVVTGSLFYDGDGSGPTDAIQFARITSLVGKFGSADFVVI